MAKETGWVLPKEETSSTDEVVFGTVPGRYMPGEPVAISALGGPGGITVQEMRDLVKETGVPLKETKADVPDPDEIEPGTAPSEPENTAALVGSPEEGAEAEG